MKDFATILVVALASALVVAGPGWVLLRLIRRRSITLNVCVLLAVTVLAVLAGILAVAGGMFISEHDLHVLLIVIAIAGVVSILIGLWLGRRLAADAMWAAEVRERERHLEASRRELVAWVSHDLRTPLAGLRAMAEALEDGVVNDAATIANYHRRMRLDSDRMATLVDDLFELSRINAGALRLSLAAVSLGDVVSDVVSTAAALADARRVRLVAAGTGWPTIRGSEPELNRVVTNLLRNAIRHTPDDGTVAVTGGIDGGRGWLAVTDGCGGIPEADLPRVFDVAFRGASARTPRASGANGDLASELDGGGGLGLAIVRGLVEAHRGEVAVTNVPGGCRFTVSLPAR